MKELIIADEATSIDQSTWDIKYIPGETKVVKQIDEISVAQVLGRRLFTELNKGMTVSLSSYFHDWSNYGIALPLINEIPIHEFPSIDLEQRSANDNTFLTVRTHETTTPLDVRNLTRHILTNINSCS